jgi:hypothetical protein
MHLNVSQIDYKGDMPMDYDAQRSSLYQPHLAATVFEKPVLHVHDWVCAELSRLAYTPFLHDLTQNWCWCLAPWSTTLLILLPTNMRPKHPGW